MIDNNRQINLKNHKGFSLIELLVVISIIGVLIGLSAFGLQGARQSARDARRVADIEQIRSGLELYKADCGNYPSTTDFPGAGGNLLGDGSPLSCLSSNTYISNRPQDPNPGKIYRYNRISPTTYEICAAMEANTSTISCQGMTPGLCPDASHPCNYKVKNP